MMIHVDALWTAVHQVENPVPDTLTGRLIVRESGERSPNGDQPTTLGCFNILTPLKDRVENGEVLPYIPPGTFDLALDVPSPKFSSLRYHKWAGPKDPCVPRVLAVPGHSGILIHPGNVRSDSRGCILVGTSLIYSNTGIPALHDSVSAYRKLVRLLRGKSGGTGRMKINFIYNVCWL